MNPSLRKRSGVQERPASPTLRRRSLAVGAALSALLAWGGAAAAPRPRPACRGWPLWEAFLARFVQADGRVIDDQHDSRYTTSEGMAYALFFALVANDRARFETLLRWTEVHLADGDLRAWLPGWRWGRRDDGQWALLDRNPAADADMWLAHTLFEAARLWKAQGYQALGAQLLQRIRREEVVELPGFGPMVLPAPLGFQLGPALWRFNPSYLPLHQLRAFARLDPQGPWQRVAENSLALLRAASPLGFAPDWVNYSPERGWHAGPDSPALGSYDAIRVYLWAGLLDRRDPLQAELLETVRGMRRYLDAGRPAPPQQVRTDSGAVIGTSPPGFSGALLPYLQASRRPALLARQLERLRAMSEPHSENGAADACSARGGATGLVGQPPTYYDQVLTLFGQGALEGRYRFDVQGRLHPAW